MTGKETIQEKDSLQESSSKDASKADGGKTEGNPAKTECVECRSLMSRCKELVRKLLGLT